MSDDAPDTAARPGPRRLTPVEVQQQVFRRAMFRGYNEQDVDDFLDEVTEELAMVLEEQRRLRDQVGGGVTEPLTGGQDVAEAKRMADDIVRQAHEEAAEIIRKARTEAAAAGASTGNTSAVQPFLAQERVFLQDLSRLVQSHADTVRDMARAQGRATGGAPAPQAGQGKEEATAEASPADTPQNEEDSASPPAQAEAASSKPKGRGRARRRTAEQGDPSLKELFWGEES